MDDSKSVICVANPDAGIQDEEYRSKVSDERYIFRRCGRRRVPAPSYEVWTIARLALRDYASTLSRVASNLNHVAGPSSQVVADAKAVAHIRFKYRIFRFTTRSSLQPSRLALRTLKLFDSETDVMATPVKTVLTGMRFQEDERARWDERGAPGAKRTGLRERTLVRLISREAGWVLCLARTAPSCWQFRRRGPVRHHGAVVRRRKASAEQTDRCNRLFY